MRNIIYTLLPLFLFGCSIDKPTPTDDYEIPSRDHDLSYTPYDLSSDSPSFIICDSTKIRSGRNRLRYIDGTNKLKEDIISNYSYRQEYASFSGYIVIRFLVNCEGESGRYRAQPLNLDFSPSTAPSDLLTASTELIKSLDNWVKSSNYDAREEYSKYINLKIEDGKVQHVLL